MSIYFEYAKPYRVKYKGCDKYLIRLTRFIRHGLEEIGYYFVEIDEAEEDKFVKCLIVFCERDEQGEFISRLGFPLMIWLDGDDYKMSLRDKNEFPWEEEPDLTILDRKESIVHPLKDFVFEIADQIVKLDLQVENYLTE